MSICIENDKVPCGAVSRTARIIAIDEKSGKLAVVRKQKTSSSHDYVEFYNILTGWLATPEIVVCPENGSIEHALFVANGELMTSHANGSICFIDPHDNRRVKRVQIAASTIWAACDHPVIGSEEKSKVALISHSSILYFYDVINKIILSSVSLGVDSRLFNVSSNGELVAIGSIDGIMIASNGKVERTLKLDRENRRDPTIAWTVLFWKSDVLACGDSRGIVTLWDPNSGALIQAVACMQSHILTMCLAEGQLNVAGVDPRITEIRQLSSGKYDVTRRRNGPVRDVRSLASYEDRVYASGEDFEIFVGKDGCRELLMQWQKSVRIGNEIVASNGENWVDIWWKKAGEDEPASGTDVLVQHHKSIYLAKIFATKNNIITCWALSECGKYLAIGTTHDTSVYSIFPELKKKKIKKIASFAISPTFIHINEKDMIVATGNFKISKFDLEKNAKNEPKTVLEQADCGSIVKMSISKCGKTISVITSRSQLFLVNLENGESTLGKVELPIDVVCNSQSAFVISTQPAFSENCDAKKIFFEVGVSNGIVKRSTSSIGLKMIPTSPKSAVPGLPTSILAVDDHRFMVSSYDGHWAIVDTTNGCVISTSEGPIKAKKQKMSENVGISVVGFRKESRIDPPSTPKVVKRTRKSSSLSEEIEPIHSRIVILQVEGTEQPKTNAFRLKKFGMQ